MRIWHNAVCRLGTIILHIASSILSFWQNVVFHPGSGCVWSHPCLGFVRMSHIMQVLLVYCPMHIEDLEIPLTSPTIFHLLHSKRECDLGCTLCLPFLPQISWDLPRIAVSPKPWMETYIFQTSGQKTLAATISAMHVSRTHRPFSRSSQSRSEYSMVREIQFNCEQTCMLPPHNK